MRARRNPSNPTSSLFTLAGDAPLAGAGEGEERRSSALADDPIREAARNAHRAGLAVVPPKEDGTKTPLPATWKEYQRRRPTAEELRAWYAEGRGGVGLVMGAVSGDLETMEFDDRPTYERYIEIAQGTGLGDVVSRIRAGYEETTPGGGVHWPYRCADIAGNTTLARRPTDDPKRLQVLIQTRGEGGYLVVAPSNGTVHPTGGAYRLVSGGFASIATISPEERQGLWDLARTFDECPRPAREEPVAPTSSAGNRPGDHFNQRATWDEILAPHDWVLVHERGGVGYWRRPGKARGLSATTNHAGSGLFYPFTSSTVFDPERGYSKFAVYCTLAHGGNFRAAADALGKAGYGAELPKPRFGRMETPAGSGDAPEDAEELRLERLAMIANDPPLYRLVINGQELGPLTTDEVMTFNLCRKRCFERLRRFISLPRLKGQSRQDQWEALIEPLPLTMEVAAIPEETTETGQLREDAHDWLLNPARQTQRADEVARGLVLAKGDALFFRVSDLRRHLVEGGHDRRGLGGKLWSAILAPAGATQTTIRITGSPHPLSVIRYPLSAATGPEQPGGQLPIEEL
jgi:hypothetical protein